MYMNTYLYLHVYMFLSARVAMLIMCSGSFLSTDRKPMFKIVPIGWFYGHVITICLPSLKKVTLVNVFIYIH